MELSWIGFGLRIEFPRKERLCGIPLIKQARIPQGSQRSTRWVFYLFSSLQGPSPNQEPLGTLLSQNSRCAPAHIHSEREGGWRPLAGWRPCWGECVLGYPSTDAPRTRDPSVALASATWRCFALLGASAVARFTHCACSRGTVARCHVLHRLTPLLLLQGRLWLCSWACLLEAGWRPKSRKLKSGLLPQFGDLLLAP